jgi:hypothetical protein
MERRYQEILRKVSKEVKDFKDEEERKRLEEERRRMEEEKRRIEAERHRLEEEARKRAEEEARRAAEARRKAEEERRRAEAEQKQQEAERQKSIEAERRRLEAEAFARRFVGTFHAWTNSSHMSWEKIKIISEDEVVAWGNSVAGDYTARYALNCSGDRLRFTLTHIENCQDHCDALEGTINSTGTTIKGWWDNNTANDYITYYRCN